MLRAGVKGLPEAKHEGSWDFQDQKVPSSKKRSGEMEGLRPDHATG